MSDIKTGDVVKIKTAPFYSGHGTSVESVANARWFYFHELSGRVGKVVAVERQDKAYLNRYVVEIDNHLYLFEGWPLEKLENL